MAKRAKNNTKGKTKAKAKPARKKASPKRAKAKPQARAVSKKAQKRNPVKNVRPRMVIVTVPQHITLDLPPALHDRLKGLSQIMGLPVEGVIRQALTEFADTWEDHHRTVSALAENSDRMMIVDKD